MKSFLISLFILASFLGVAQEKEICGFVFDEKGVPLMTAEILLMETNQKSGDVTVLSDENGFFCLPLLPNGDYMLITTLTGMVGSRIDLNLQPSDTLKIILKEDTCVNFIRIRKEGAAISKPAIYLYPTQKTIVNIQHDFKGEIGTTYPAYKNGWKVIAEPDGALLNLADNRKYEYLFWDGIYTFPATHFDYKEGFVVSKENTTDFLWKQLAYIGLNEKEINDFVVYWLPQLERNDHNFIYFHINNDIDQSSVLTVQPKPDSWIRLFMEFKPVPAGYSIAEQKLPSIKRDGFTLVEWGGAVIENSATDFE